MLLFGLGMIALGGGRSSERNRSLGCVPWMCLHQTEGEGSREWDLLQALWIAAAGVSTNRDIQWGPGFLTPA